MSKAPTPAKVEETPAEEIKAPAPVVADEIPPVVNAAPPAEEIKALESAAAETSPAADTTPPEAGNDTEDSFVLVVKNGEDSRNYEPASWTFKPTGVNAQGVEVVYATNSSTGSEFEGTVEQFNALLRNRD